MSDSVWKKEISFRRKPKDVAPAPAPAPAPETAEELRQKELEFQRRLEAAADAAVTPPPAPAAGDSVWKKEITFRRKPAAPAPEAPAPEAPAPEAPAPFAAEPEPMRADEQPAAPESIWKKEIHLRRKSAARPGEEKSESLWTKDISLRRREARTAQIQLLASEAMEQVAGNVIPEPWLTDPELPPAPIPEPEPVAPAAAPEPKAEKQSVWKREIGKSKPKEPKRERGARKRKTRLRDVQITLPSHSSGGHAVKRLVGLKIGASQLAAARVNNNGAAELVQVARQPLDQGVIVGGEVRDPEALAIALKQFFARNKLPKKNVRLGIASNRIGVRIFDLVGIDDEKQLENAIRFRAQETLPIPLDEAVLDYHVLGETTDEDGTQLQRVLLVVAYRELVDRYVAACRKAGITLAGIDLEAFALLRSLAAPRPEDVDVDSALVAVAVGHDRSTFAVSDGRTCEFTRVIEWGGSTLSVAIARALDLAPSEVEQIKRLVSLESPDVPEGVSPEQYALAVDAVRRQVQAFARELVSSLQFYQHQPGSLGIGEIVITGGTAGLHGLAAELERMIGVHVRVGDPLARLKVAKKLPLDVNVGSLAVAIGLGIED